MLNGIETYGQTYKDVCVIRSNDDDTWIFFNVFCRKKEGNVEKRQEGMGLEASQQRKQFFPAVDLKRFCLFNLASKHSCQTTMAVGEGDVIIW